ncbi:piggyBac transposable element-derived protein 3-like [Watersipora subatra]|uniref:piggyBac transposable element-derived protein 3-like n=1 Tax=Watersipora subatra TaxID=2589382 RepID=UPI00355AF892
MTVDNVLDEIDGNSSDYEGLESDDDDDFDATQQTTNLHLQQESDNESEDEEEEPTNGNAVRGQRREYRWLKANFTPSALDFTGPKPEPPVDGATHTPLEYFRRFISTEMIDNIVQQTNIYSVQKTGTSVQTDHKEIEKIFGVYFHMGLVRMSSVRQYWEIETSYPPVSTAICRNRFRDLLTKLHVVNNLTASDENKQKDKLWKVRPWLESFRENCLKLTPEENVSIDEMMCEFRGKTNPIQQYIKGKPHPWGFKIWGRADPAGILYDFDVYQGGTGQRSALGQGADVVLKLTESLKYNSNYKIFADNFFTSLGLITALNERGMRYTGTVRKNRMGQCTLLQEKELKKKGRGTIDYRVDQNHNIIAVRWYDNRAVSLLSSVTGVEPTQQVRRWAGVADALIKVNTVKRGRPSLDDSAAAKKISKVVVVNEDVRFDNIGHWPGKCESRGRFQTSQQEKPRPAGEPLEQVANNSSRHTGTPSDQSE